MKKQFYNPTSLFLLLIVCISLFLRFNSVLPFQTIVGFDQARDLFTAQEILSGDLKFIGPTAGNNPNLHHGVGFWYYLAVPLLFSSSVMNVVFFNLLINCLGVLIMYFFARSLLKSKKAGFISALLTATSYYFIQYSGWLSNPTVTLVTVPLAFYFLWQFLQKKKYGFLFASFFLGLTLQFELFFLYLIPLFIIVIAVFRRIPTRNEFVLGFAAFSVATATMIATEVKYKFGGVLAILRAGEKVGGDIGLIERSGLFIERFVQTFSYTVFPTNALIAIMSLVTLCTLAILSYKTHKSALLFVAFYTLSPALMLLLGFHNAPWFLVGLPPAFILLTTIGLYKLKFAWIILLVIVLINIKFIIHTSHLGQVLLEPDNAGKLQNQIAVVEYTYSSAEGNPFTINAVTNPLYINALWAYHYHSYGKQKYKYLPSWSGGDQLAPYNTLQKVSGEEEYLYLLMDNSPRIPEVHRDAAREWADTRSKLIETKDFNGILVEKRKLN